MILYQKFYLKLVKICFLMCFVTTNSVDAQSIISPDNIKLVIGGNGKKVTIKGKFFSKPFPTIQVKVFNQKQLLGFKAKILNSRKGFSRNETIA